MNISQILGFIGAFIVVAAYLPQVTHLIRERCSAGISLRAFLLWFIASLLLLIHALMIRDIVFTTLQILNLVLIGTICFYTNKFRTGLCQSHLSTKGRISG